MKDGDFWRDAKVLKSKEFQEILGVSPNKFKSLLDSGRLPKPLPFGDKCRRWSSYDVAKFLGMAQEEQQKRGRNE